MVTIQKSKCYKYTVLQKSIGYHPTFNGNFNSSHPIPVILVQLLLSEYAIENWFHFPPQLFSVLTLRWETSRP